MKAELRLQVQFVYTNLALEQIGELGIANLALRNTIDLLSSDGFFLQRTVGRREWTTEAFLLEEC